MHWFLNAFDCIPIFFQQSSFWEKDDRGQLFSSSIERRSTGSRTCPLGFCNPKPYPLPTFTLGCSLRQILAAFSVRRLFWIWEELPIWTEWFSGADSSPGNTHGTATTLDICLKPSPQFTCIVLDFQRLKLCSSWPGSLPWCRRQAGCSCCPPPPPASGCSPPPPSAPSDSHAHWLKLQLCLK